MPLRFSDMISSQSLPRIEKSLLYVGNVTLQCLIFTPNLRVATLAGVKAVNSSKAAADDLTLIDRI
jgi:hypothetical protein